MSPTGRIRTIAEYEVVVASIVVAQQVGTITLLSEMIGRYDRRRLSR